MGLRRFSTSNLIAVAYLLSSFTVLINAAIQQPKDWPCPVDEEILPCTCVIEKESVLIMNCSTVQTNEQLELVFTANFPATITVFRMDHSECSACNVTRLSNDVFGETRFEEVYILNTDLEEVEINAFQSSEFTLKILDLSHNRISSFPFYTIGQFSILSELYLSNNYIDFNTDIGEIKSNSLTVLSLSNNPHTVIDAKLVINSPDIKEVYLENVALLEVPQNDQHPYGMFTNLENIRTVSFANNLLSILETDTVTGITDSLISVDFSNNRISEVHPYFVSGFGFQGRLDMQNNNVKHLDEFIWRPILEDLSGNRSFNIAGNPVDCSCQIAWLVLNETLMSTVTNDSTCEGGTQAINQLPKDWFTINC